MKIANKIVKNIIGTGKKMATNNDWDGDSVINKNDCQPKNPFRQEDRITAFNIPGQGSRKQLDIIGKGDMGEQAMAQHLARKNQEMKMFRKSGYKKKRIV